MRIDPKSKRYLAALEGLTGYHLPKVILTDPAKPGERVRQIGEFDIGAYRHGTVRPLRSELPTGEAFAGYTVFDGTPRGLTPEQKTLLAQDLKVEPEMIRVVSIFFGQRDPAAPQYNAEHTESVEGLLVKLAQQGRFNRQDLASGRILYIPAGLHSVAATDAAAIYGLSEAWPQVVRVSGERPFPYKEVFDAHSLTQWGVKRRKSLQEGPTRLVVSGPISEDKAQRLAAFAAELGLEFLN